LITLVGFALVLGPLVFIHELGHYLVGRLFGVRADVFSIGFGKELLGWTDRRGTRWKISALPLGGFVQFAGDSNAAGQPSAEWLALPADERAQTLQGRPLWQRALIVLAGPVTNLLVAVFILAGFALAYGTVVAPPVIGMVEQGSVAQRAGLQVGDRVITLRGAPIDSFMTIAMTIKTHPGEHMDMVIDRHGQQIALSFTPAVKIETDRFGNSEAIGRLGVAPATATRRPVGPIGALIEGATETRDILALTVTAIEQIVTGRRDTHDLGGPIKIAKYSGEMLVSGWQTFVLFIAQISIGLGFVNLLPIPVLDGGHLVLFAAEAIRRKPVSQRAQEYAFGTGLALVVALMLFVTFNDVSSLKLFGG
jgi:regulator of sigma E protease